MNPTQTEGVSDRILRSRRDFLLNAGSGIGSLALATLLQEDGALAAEHRGERAPTDRVARAKNCIFLFLAGAPSQLDLFDPKPALRDRAGERLPDSLTRTARFAFINKDAVLMGSPRTFVRHGRCGTEFSELLPQIGACSDDIALIRSLHTDAFNHHPAQLVMNTGFDRFGRPSLGAWLNYGLGSVSRNLPGYVVLWSGETTQGATSLWTNGFLPPSHQGVLFRSQGEPVLNLHSPPGVTAAAQRRTLDGLAELNGYRARQVADPEIESRIAAYETAFRMQTAAPELTDLSSESAATRSAYGVDRPEPVQRSFATNCLLARRLVERGVRFVNLYMGGWDQHGNLNKALAANCRVVDQPVAALLQDLKQRGMLDETLVVWAAEFGRTPLCQGALDDKAGRDHHPHAYSVWMAGGGTRGGQVIGATDELGWLPAQDPVHINDFHATILHLFGVDHRRLTYKFQGREFRLTDVGGRVVARITGTN